ncbi:hypothetical protein B0J14DRAFT_585637 [Halenospora varia]|nr:hypothetical protein B0J14DRAFT_585637 [Halenospora varia]
MPRTTRTSTRIEAKKGAIKPADELPTNPTEKSSQRVLQPLNRQLKRQRITEDEVEETNSLPSKPLKKPKSTDLTSVSSQGVETTKEGRAASKKKAATKLNTRVESSASSTGKSSQRSDSNISTETPPAGQTQTPSTSWDVEGQYKIASAFTIDEHSNTRQASVGVFTLKIFFQSTGSDRQLYATFQWGKLEGVMRFCPWGKENTGTSVAGDFEELCDLDDKTRPGEEFPAWGMRWRATEDRRSPSRGLVESKMDSKAIFKHDPISSKDYFTAMNMSFTLNLDGDTFIFRTSKYANLSVGESAAAAWSLKRKWKDLSPKSTPAIPYTTSAIVPRALKTKYSDDCPDWAWDIRGSWDMDLPGGHDYFGLDPDKKITMQIQMCRTVSKSEVSRQLWAILGSGSLRTFGMMRFCPASAGTKYIKEFEKACKLMDGSWPGPAGKGDQTWSMRCRAAGAEDKRISDEWQTDVKFTRDDYGSLRASGVLMLGSDATAFEAFKFGYTGPSYDTGFVADLKMSKQF